MPNKRSIGKLEAKLARNYVYQNSTSACRNRDPDEVRERIYTGTSEQVVCHVLAEIGRLEQKNKTNIKRAEIPEYPQGLVISDSKGEGFFDNPANLMSA